MKHVSKFRNFKKGDESLSQETIDTIKLLGGMSAIVGIAFASAKSMINQTKKEIVDKLKAKGEEIPNDKELTRIAGEAVRSALDKATGN